MLGQVSVDPTVTPVLNNGGWVFNAAELLALLGIVLTLAIVFGYMRLAPRFQTDEQTRRSVKVPRMQPGQEVRRPVKVIGTPIVVQAPVIAPAAGTVAVAAAAGGGGGRGGGPPPAAPGHGDVTLDQETFDRVLAELLEKGTDRRVAEGQARRAAMIAARKKAEG